MSPVELENLVRIGKLKAEPPRDDELAGLLVSGDTRLADARREDLSFDSRFDLAYNAAHAFALHALRRLGYRSDTRYVVFQALPHTSGLDGKYWRVLAKAHGRRNASEYEGYLERDEQLLSDLIAATEVLRSRI
jgi:hypothetical protein